MLVAEWDFDVEKEVAWEEGMIKGMEKGMVKGKVEIAKAMRAKGMDVNTIAELTKLTVDDILRM
ncbi:MAG: hypothetical protein LBC70_00835 [Chitinispirillales bacterium]|nr:hypothetical protein [Chitinispirillales bacterium]